MNLKKTWKAHAGAISAGIVAIVTALMVGEAPDSEAMMNMSDALVAIGGVAIASGFGWLVSYRFPKNQESDEKPQK